MAKLATPTALAIKEGLHSDIVTLTAIKEVSGLPPKFEADDFVITIDETEVYGDIYDNDTPLDKVVATLPKNTIGQVVEDEKFGLFFDNEGGVRYWHIKDGWLPESNIEVFLNKQYLNIADMLKFTIRPGLGLVGFGDVAEASGYYCIALAREEELTKATKENPVPHLEDIVCLMGAQENKIEFVILCDRYNLAKNDPSTSVFYAVSEPEEDVDKLGDAVWRISNSTQSVFLKILLPDNPEISWQQDKSYYHDLYNWWRIEVAFQPAEQQWCCLYVVYLGNPPFPVILPINTSDINH